MVKRTRKDVSRNILVRREAWDNAVEILDPIFEKNGLEDYHMGPGLFVSGVNYTNTKAEQNIDHILRVADWLLEPLI